MHDPSHRDPDKEYMRLTEQSLELVRRQRDSLSAKCQRLEDELADALRVKDAIFGEAGKVPDGIRGCPPAAVREYEDLEWREEGTLRGHRVVHANGKVMAWYCVGLDATAFTTRKAAQGYADFLNAEAAKPGPI